MLATLMAAMPPLATADTGYGDLPDLGASAQTVINPVQEERLGQAFMRQVRRSEPVVNDPFFSEYLRNLGEDLATNSEWAGSSFDFFLIDKPEINAFAGPGGHIGVYSGLILTTDSESELAAVLAHEISHVTQRHLLRAWDSTSNMSMVSAAALLAAVVLGVAVGGDAAIAAAAGTQAALAQQQINFTRSNEEEADRIGIGILADTGFDPRAMPSFFERMGRANQTYATEIPEFLRTHPVTKNRIADSTGRAEQYPYKQRPDSSHYHLIKAALKERSFFDPREATRFFQQSLDDGRYRDQNAVRYGLVLAQLRNHEPAAALETARVLRQQQPAETAFVLVEAQALSELKKDAESLALLQQALTENPHDHPLRMALAERLIQAEQGDAAYPILTEALRQRPDDVAVRGLLGHASAQMGRGAESHEHLAEYHYQRGNLEGAILQLEIALREPRLDFYQASRVESRLTELKREKEELEAEKKRK